MQQSDEAGAAAARAVLTQRMNSLPADGQLRYNNYGKGDVLEQPVRFQPVR